MDLLGGILNMAEVRVSSESTSVGGGKTGKALADRPC